MLPMREDVVYASREAHVPKIFARTVLEAEIMIAITFFFLQKCCSTCMCTITSVT